MLCALQRRCSARQQKMISCAQRQLASRGATGALEFGTVMDRFQPNASFLKGWGSFFQSTMQVAQIRQNLPEFTVPKFTIEASEIYTQVGAALAAADEKALRRLTTPSCFAGMRENIRGRPFGQRQKWETLSVTARVRQVRVGHHKSHPERHFAQVTCSIDASVLWTVRDKSGARVGGVGSADEPYQASDLWVFERCVTDPPEPPAWRLKEKMPVQQ